MTIDTAEKRRAASGVPFLPLGPGVTPNAAKPVAWRQEAAWGYSGIQVGPPTPPPVGTGVFTVSGASCIDLFPTEGVTYTYAAITRRTN